MSPQWSPDGRWIVFGAGAYFVARATSPAHIMMVKSDGSEVRTLTTGPGNSGFPSWSPDGKHVLFTWDRAGVSNLYVSDGNGPPKALTKRPSRRRSASQYSPPAYNSSPNSPVNNTLVPCCAAAA